MHKRSLLCVRVRTLFHYRWYQRRRHTRITPFPPLCSLPLRLPPCTQPLSRRWIYVCLSECRTFLVMIHARGNLPSRERCDNATNESFGSMISGREGTKAFDTCSRRDHRFSGRKLLGSPRNSPRRVALEDFKLLRDDTVTGWRRAILCFLRGEEAEALRWCRRT